MKKHLLLAAFFACSFTATAQTTITQNTDSDLVEADGSVGCPGGANNTFSRSFVMEDFDISTDWFVSEVEFGLQDYVAGTEITITLSTTSEAYPGGYPGSLTELASETVTFEDDGESLFVLKQVAFDNVLVPAGSELVVEVTGAFFIGGNTQGSTAPSYLMSVDCGAETPTDVADLAFPDVNYVINVTGNTTAGTNDVLASKFSVFPNPTSDVINIANAENILVNGVTITDINGRTVKSAQFADVANATVNVSDLASGVYMMTVTSDKGTAVKKIVKN